MTISYNEIDINQKGQVTDLLSKREAIESLLADLQTERANQEAARAPKEQELKKEANIITEELRNLRTAMLT